MPELREMNALVTGAGSGIGRAIAVALGRVVASVALVGRRSAELEAVAAAIKTAGGRALPLALDITDFEAVKRAHAAVLAMGAKVDILVNNAGIAESAALEKTSDALWDKTMAINVRAPYLLTRLFAPAMAERGFGRIVNIASIAALEGSAYTAAYTASKHGLLGMTRAFSKEFAPRGVTVNAVCPGYTKTAIVERAATNISSKTGKDADWAVGELIKNVPIGRLVEPDEVAAAVLYLVSKEAAATSGIALTVAGGAAEG